MGNSNSISNEECDAKIRKMVEEGEKTGKQAGKQEYINKMNEKKDMIFEVMIEGLKSGEFKESIFTRLRRDRDNYIDHIDKHVTSGVISVPDNDDPTNEEKEEYISRISNNINREVDDIISRFDNELTTEISDSKISKMKRDWDQGMEKLLELIDTDETFNSNAATNSAKFLGQMFYVLLIRGDLAKRTFNLHKGVIYNPPYIDGSAGEGDALNGEEGFVNNVEDNNDGHNFSKILLVLIIIVLFLHLFTDLKIF